jgi:hypothetical protein
LNPVETKSANCISTIALYPLMDNPIAADTASQAAQRKTHKHFDNFLVV